MPNACSERGDSGQQVLQLDSSREDGVMRKMALVLAFAGAWSTVAAGAGGEQQGDARGDTAANDPVRTLVSRLDIEKYKATIKGLTQFGDRRQGTERNRKAIDWIEAQLKSYGCPTERLHYEFNPPPPATPTPPAAE